MGLVKVAQAMSKPDGEEARTAMYFARTAERPNKLKFYPP